MPYRVLQVVTSIWKPTWNQCRLWNSTVIWMHWEASTLLHTDQLNFQMLFKVRPHTVSYNNPNGKWLRHESPGARCLNPGTKTLGAQDNLVKRPSSHGCHLFFQQSSLVNPRRLLLHPPALTGIIWPWKKFSHGYNDPSSWGGHHQLFRQWNEKF